MKDHTILGAGGGKKAPMNTVKTHVRTWRMIRSRSWESIAPSYVMGDAEALTPVNARTCYSRDESGLLKRDNCEGATQACKSVKGTNFLVNIMEKILYL
jgi:hypothetical protein